MGGKRCNNAEVLQQMGGRCCNRWSGGVATNGRVNAMAGEVCHGSTGSPSALLRRVLRGGVTVLEGAGVLARGTRSCT